MVLLGGGGHGRVLIDIIRLVGGYEIVGILDAGLKKGVDVSGVPVLGGDDLLDELFGKRGVRNACVGVGSTTDSSTRKTLYIRLKDAGFLCPSLVHPRAVVSKEARLSEGVQVMAGAVIQTGAEIGENTIINTGAIVEHDCRVGKNVHVCPGAVIGGGSSVAEGSFIGAGATLIHGVSVGKCSVIGAGSVVVSDVPDNSKIMGVPAK